jgi:hypothetical protein
MQGKDVAVRIATNVVAARNPHKDLSVSNASTDVVACGGLFLKTYL